MIRLAHTSDLHIDERGRLDDTVRVLEAFREQAAEAKVDLILIAGDLFERRSTPAERNVLADFLQTASAVAPVFVVKGNHDAKEDLEIFNHLEVVNEVRLLDRPTAAPGSAITWMVNCGRMVGLLALPWFDKAYLVAGVDATVDAETTRQATIAAARDLLVCLRAEASRVRAVGAVPILATHIMLGGSVVATGQILIGQSVELSPSDLLEVGAAYVACGHIHKRQEWFGGRVAYSGSPNRCNFGESEPKGWNLVTLTDGGEFVSNEFRELPARRMVLIEEDWTDPDAVRRVSGTDDVAGALVRWRYRIRAEDLHLVDEAAIRAGLEIGGAHEIVIEPVVVAETRARTPEIVKAQSTAEKLDFYLAAKGVVLEDAARARVHAKLATLEAA